MDRLLIVPAAGRGSRLGKSAPKALVPVCGRPMLAHVIDLHGPVIDGAVAVVAPEAIDAFDGFRQTVKSVPLQLATQASPTGMLDAILAAQALVARHEPRRVAVTWCDQIAVERTTAALLASLALGTESPALVFPTFMRREPYIHFERDARGRITRVRQRREGDEMPERGETDLGLFDMSLPVYLEYLHTFAREAAPATATGERNFLPFIPWLSSRLAVTTFAARAFVETVGINTPEELAFIERHLCGSTFA